MSLVNVGLRLMLSALSSGGSPGLDKADSQSGSPTSPMQVYPLSILSLYIVKTRKTSSLRLWSFCGRYWRPIFVFIPSF